MSLFPKGSFFDRYGNHWLKTNKSKKELEKIIEDSCKEVGLTTEKKEISKDGTVMLTIVKGENK